MVSFIDDNREEFGVEPICEMLQVAPSTYYAAKKRVPSARALRDAVLMPVLYALWVANFEVYGVHKLWKAMLRAGHEIGRDQTARLMRQLGIRGVQKGGKKPKTTRSDPAASRPPDLVERRFWADAPNLLWVMDLTYVPTWSGVAYVCFITDVFSRMIVGWRVASHMRTHMVLDALEMARWNRGTHLEGLVAHSDAGSQGEFKWWSQHLDDGGGLWRSTSISGCRRSGSCGGRSGLRGGLRRRGVSTGYGFGTRSAGVFRLRTLPLRRVCRRRLERGGSARLVGCRPSGWPRCRAAICRSWSVRRSQS
jgi:putative transposase